MRSLAVLLMCSCSVAAQEEFAPAVAGYVAGGPGRVRVIAGAAGAARQIERTGYPERFLLHSGSGAVLDLAAAEVAGEPTLAVWSPLGTASALYWRDTGHIAVFRHTAGGQRLERRFDWSEPIDTLAVSDNGGAVAIGTASGLFGVDADLPKLIFSGRTAALAFEPAGSDVVVVDAASRAVWQIGAGRKMLAAAVPADPAAVALASDHTLITAHRGGLIRVLRPSGQAAEVTCRCEPRLLQAMVQSGVWRLTDGTDDLLWLLDTNAREPRTVFVPAPEAAR